MFVQLDVGHRSGARDYRQRARRVRAIRPRHHAPPITVNARPEGSLTVPGVEEQRRNVLQTPGSVGFIDSESLKGTYANDLRDVLKDVPGVFVQTRYGQELRRLDPRFGNRARLSTRAASRSCRMASRSISPMAAAISTRSTRSVCARSEVYKGGNALPFGTSTFGGAINFVTPTAHTAIAPNCCGLDGGSFGTVARQRPGFARVGRSRFPGQRHRQPYSTAFASTERSNMNSSTPMSATGSRRTSKRGSILRRLYHRSEAARHAQPHQALTNPTQAVRPARSPVIRRAMSAPSGSPTGPP